MSSAAGASRPSSRGSAEHVLRSGPRRQTAGLSVGNGRPVSLLRLPRRRLPERQCADGARGFARGPRPGAGLRRQGWLAHVSRRDGSRISLAPASRIRDGDDRPPRPHRSFRFAGRHGALRRRRRPVADGGTRHRARGDVSARRRGECESAGALPDLAQSAGPQQDGGAAFHDALVRGHPACDRDRRERRRDRNRRDRRSRRRHRAAFAAAEIVGVGGRFGCGDPDARDDAAGAVDASRRSRHRLPPPPLFLQGIGDGDRGPARLRGIDDRAARGRRRRARQWRSPRPSS